MTAANHQLLNGDQPSFIRFMILILPKLILVVTQGLRFSPALASLLAW